MKKYFSVTTKCGHVGRLNCVWIDFAIYAESAKEAAEIARQKGRAKHHHKNTIKEVIYKLIEFTSSYEKKEVLEFNNTKWL